MVTIRGWILFVAAALLAVSTGCVTQGKYDSLATSYEAVRAENSDLRVNNQRLEARVRQLNTTRSEIAERLTETREMADELLDTYEGLVTELQVEVAAGQIELLQLVDGIQLNVADELLFDSGSARLHESGRAVIVRVAEQIKDESAIISIEGHTDSVRISERLKASFPTNWELAGARAAIVVRTLSEAGVDPVMLRAVSRGPFAPIASNENAEGRAKNRRTEIILRPLPTGA